MSWELQDWRTVDAAAVEGAEVLADFVAMSGSAIEEAASALALGPVTVASLTMADAAAGSLPGGFLGVASYELLGTGRRTLWVALDPSAGTTLAGREITLDALAAAVVEALDAVMSALLGDGLSIQAAEAAAPDSSADHLLVRMAFVDAAGFQVAIVAAVDPGLPLELVTHVTALQALGGGRPAASASPRVAAPAPSFVAPAPAPSSPAPAPIPAAAPGPPVMPEGDGGSRVRPFVLDQLNPAPIMPITPNIDLLLGVSLSVTVELGRASLAIRDVLSLSAGSIVELDKLAGEKVDVLVNGCPIAQGEVVVVDENFGVRITDVVSRQRRILSANGAA